MKKLLIITQAILIATVLFTSCNKNTPYMNGGKTITSDRNIDTNYTALLSEGSFNIEIVENQDYAIRIICPQNKLQYITTSVVNGSLYITEENNRVNSNSPIQVYVNKSLLSFVRNDGSGYIKGQIVNSENLNVENYGSGNIDLSGFEVNETVILNSGSGNISLYGVTNDLFIENEGSGNINGFDLISEDASIRIDGSGNATVNVSELLNVTIAGSGNVVYKGSPAIQVNITGSGTVLPY